MAPSIQGIFFDPPVAVARIGRSSSPVDAYTWSAVLDPHQAGQTIVVPAWTLDVQADGRAVPRLPDTLAYHDGNGLIRPVAPFFEVWAFIGEADSDRSTWSPEPLTGDLLRRFKLAPADVGFSVLAMNSKAARRAKNPELAFGTYDPVQRRGDQHDRCEINGTSPPWARNPLIPAGRNIPLGFFQVIRPSPQPSQADATPWAGSLRLDVIRVRFTPPGGFTYGPPGSDQPLSGRTAGAVQACHDFLNPAAGWAGTLVGNTPVSPSDTFDGAENSQLGGPSLGIVDDTCDIRLQITLGDFSALASILVGPPDFAPDRRPFLSLADELNDRERPTPNAEAQDLDRWVEDLFERIYETVSLFNVDRARARFAADLLPVQINPHPNPADSLLDKRALAAVDLLRNPTFSIPAPIDDRLPLPISAHARERHHDLAQIESLRDFVRSNPGRLRQLIREPFAIEVQEFPDSGLRTTMQMPPFMRHGNAGPLSLSAWQYALLMRWVAANEPPPALAKSLNALADSPAAKPLSPAASAHRARVLQRRAEASIR